MHRRRDAVQLSARRFLWWPEHWGPSGLGQGEFLKFLQSSRHFPSDKKHASFGGVLPLPFFGFLRASSNSFWCWYRFLRTIGCCFGRSRGIGGWYQASTGYEAERLVLVNSWETSCVRVFGVCSKNSKIYDDYLRMNSGKQYTNLFYAYICKQTEKDAMQKKIPVVKEH